MDTCVCVCVYLPEVSHGGGQRALGGDKSRVSGIMIHLFEGLKKENKIKMGLQWEEK